MTDTTQHSPLPFLVSETPGLLKDKGGWQVATCPIGNRDTNAQFIVEACNSHAALVEALQGLLTQAMKLCLAHGQDAPEDFTNAMEAARAALTLAKGGK